MYLNTPKEEFEKLRKLLEDESEKFRNKYCSYDSYALQLNNLQKFIEMLFSLIDLTEDYWMVKEEKNLLTSIRKSYLYQIYTNHPIMTAKIDFALETIKIIKSQELIQFPCHKNVDVFNALNNEDYTHLVDVIDWVSVNQSDPNECANSGIQKKLCKSIEKTIQEGESVSMQQLNYIIDSIYTLKDVLKAEKNSLQTEQEKLNKKIEQLKNALGEKRENQKQCGDDIKKFVGEQSDETVALIFAFCSQLNLFDVTSYNQISCTYDTAHIYSEKSYIWYINMWVDQLTRVNFWRC
jgi:hypothetical protein